MADDAYIYFSVFHAYTGPNNYFIPIKLKSSPPLNFLDIRQQYSNVTHLQMHMHLGVQPQRPPFKVYPFVQPGKPLISRRKQF